MAKSTTLSSFGSVASRDLRRTGKSSLKTATSIVVTRIGVAVRKSAAQPDISTSEAVKRSMLAAKSVTHGNPAYGGISGVHVVKVFERLGIAEAMKAKTIFLDKAGLAGVLVASGKAEMVIQPIQELVVVAGIDVVGPLPEELQDTVTYQAAILPDASENEPLNALINHLPHLRQSRSLRLWAWSRAEALFRVLNIG